MEKAEVKDIRRINDRAVGVMETVAERHNLPLEKSKKETIVFGKGRRNRKEVERVKWLGIIYDSTLTFDYY